MLNFESSALFNSSEPGGEGELKIPSTLKFVHPLRVGLYSPRSNPYQFLRSMGCRRINKVLRDPRGLPAGHCILACRTELVCKCEGQDPPASLSGWLVTLHAKANFGCMRSNFHKFSSRRGARPAEKIVKRISSQ